MVSAQTNALEDFLEDTYLNILEDDKEDFEILKRSKDHDED